MLTKGFGMVSECSRSLVPRPPQNNTTFIGFSSRGQTHVMKQFAHQAAAVPNHAPQQMTVETHFGCQRQGRTVHCRKEAHVGRPVLESTASRAGRVISLRFVFQISAFPAS